MTTEIDQDYASGIAAFEAKNFKQAMQFLLPMAEEGNADAQHRVAIMYQNGLGHVENPSQAYKWMKASAEQGYALAQHGIGFMYMQGDCVDQNSKISIEWLELYKSLSEIFKTSVRINIFRNNQGKIIIPFKSETEFKKINKKLNDS